MENPWHTYEATLSEDAQDRRVLARADLERRIRRTAEGNTGDRFKDHDPRSTAASLGAHVLAAFNAHVDALRDAGLSEGIARVIGEITCIVPAQNVKPTRKTTEQPATDAERLTADERDVLQTILPERSRQSMDKLPDAVVLTTIDRMLTRTRLGLKNKDMIDWVGLRQRYETLIAHGVYTNIADALDNLDLSPKRKAELSALCAAAAKRGARMLATRNARESAARF